jgi:peptide/nickel transport system substrate-binding protein
MLLPLLAPFASAVQPPVITDTLYVGTIGWGPRRADSVRAYDTGSGELIFNVYDTLIAFDREKYWEFVPSLALNVPDRERITKTVSSTDVNVGDPTGSTWSDGSKCVGCVDYPPDGLSPGDIVYMREVSGKLRTWTVVSVTTVGSTVTVTFERYYYKFFIRQSPTIYFVNETGGVVDTFDIGDVEYSFERGLVQDQIGSPMWMFYKPLFDQMNSDAFDSNTTEPTAMTLAHLIDDAFEVNETEYSFTVNLGFAFPDIAFKQILSQTWASIVSKQFSLSIGCWNADLYTDSDGNGYPDWFAYWRHKSRSPYDTTGAYRYVGTGPYYVSVWNSVNKIVVLTRNPYYWQGWPAPGCDGYLETIQIRYIDDDDARIAGFKSGDLDVAAIPRAKMSVLVEPDVPPGDPLYDPYTNYVDVPVKTIKNIPTLTLDALHFTFTINNISAYVGSGHFPNGIPLNFFNNTHVRKAWAYAFNWSNYIRDAYYGEGMYRKNPLVYGLAPDYYNCTVPTYYESLAKAKEELEKAVFPGSGYANVWESGFELTIAYNTGNSQRQIACEMIANFFTTLSTYAGRTGSPFKVTVINLDWPIILDKFENYELPTWIIGWLADFADSDNWMRPYMHSGGDFSYFQNYTADNGYATPGPNTGLNKDQLIDLAIRTPDGEQRRIQYLDLQWIYYIDCPSVPLVQPTGRRWSQYWVKGWYNNALYPSQYYYHLWKHDTCWFDITGPTPGQYDGVCNARDITYLILHFNAKPPSPGHEEPKWVGTYGYGGVDPYGDRICNARDITWAILHFNHANKP